MSNTDESKSKSHAVSASTLAMAEQIRPLLTVAGDKIVVPADLFEKTLSGADLNLETVINVQKHGQSFVAALTKAGGELLVEHMKTNPELASGGVSTTMGMYTAEAEFERVGQYRAAPNSTDMIDVYGVSRVRVNVPGGADLKNVRHGLKTFAKSLLAEG